MIRVTAMFEIFGNAMGRVFRSMKKYLPDDVEIIQRIDRNTKVIRDTDLVIGHCGSSGFKPSYAFMTPKLILTEACDLVTGSYYGERDLMWVYNPERAKELKAQGVNVLLLPRPVDAEIFYKPDPMPEKDIDVLSVGPHDESLVLPALEVAASLDMRTQILTGLKLEGLEAITDLCQLDKDDAKLRDYYNKSKYSATLYPAYPYYEDVWTNGMEIAAAEAIFCSSRPIVFDAPQANYMKYWLGDAAYYIRRDYFREDLNDILRSDYIPPTDEQRARVIKTFDAQSMWEKVWTRVREVI